MKTNTSSSLASGKTTPPIKGIFIAGTDTGVGKTVIAGAIARALSSYGVDVGVMKPIETGCRQSKGELIPADGMYLKGAACLNDPIGSITPYSFREPLAPYTASIRDKKKIHLETILKAYDRLRRRHSFLVVEGVGGLIVPLTRNVDLLDLILLLDLPVLLIARSGLGTLNHTLLTLRYGLEHRIRFAGVVLNQASPKKTLSDETNAEVLSERITVPLAGPLPYFRKTGIQEKDIERSKKLLMGNPLLKEMVLNWVGVGGKSAMSEDGSSAYLP